MHICITDQYYHIIIMCMSDQYAHGLEIVLTPGVASPIESILMSTPSLFQRCGLQEALYLHKVTRVHRRCHSSQTPAESSETVISQHT
jgi:hypothetical protein